MSLTKTVLTGVLGGIVVFVWGALSHMALGLGETGIKAIPNEEAVLAEIARNLTESGFYIFPGYDHSAPMTEEIQKKWEEKYRQGPIGVLVFRPQGRQPMFPGQLLNELAFNILAALIVAFLLGKASGSIPGFGGRVIFVALFGLISGFDIDMSYWNWYSFPTNFTIAGIADHVIGWFLAGLLMAWLIKSKTA